MMNFLAASLHIFLYCLIICGSSSWLRQTEFPLWPEPGLTQAYFRGRIVRRGPLKGSLVLCQYPISSLSHLWKFHEHKSGHHYSLTRCGVAFFFVTFIQDANIFSLNYSTLILPMLKCFIFFMDLIPNNTKRTQTLVEQSQSKRSSRKYQSFWAGHCSRRGILVSFLHQAPSTFVHGGFVCFMNWESLLKLIQTDDSLAKV